MVVLNQFVEKQLLCHFNQIVVPSAGCQPGIKTTILYFDWRINELNYNQGK